MGLSVARLVMTDVTCFCITSIHSRFSDCERAVTVMDLTGHWEAMHPQGQHDTYNHTKHMATMRAHSRLCCWSAVLHITCRSSLLVWLTLSSNELTTFGLLESGTSCTVMSMRGRIYFSCGHGRGTDERQQQQERDMCRNKQHTNTPGSRVSCVPCNRLCCWVRWCTST